MTTAALQYLTKLRIIAFVELGGWKPETGRAFPDINVYCIALPFMCVRHCPRTVWALTLRRSELDEHPQPDAARSRFSRTDGASGTTIRVAARRAAAKV